MRQKCVIKWQKIVLEEAMESSLLLVSTVNGGFLPPLLYLGCMFCPAFPLSQISQPIQKRELLRGHSLERVMHWDLPDGVWDWPLFRLLYKLLRFWQIGCRDPQFLWSLFVLCVQDQFQISPRELLRLPTNRLAGVSRSWSWAIPAERSFL